MTKILLVSMLLIGLLSGCAQKNDKNTQEPIATQTNTGTPQSQSFEKGVFVNYSKHKNDFMTDDILQKLKDNLEALVSKDTDKFKAELMKGHDTLGNMDYVVNENQYKILDIESTQYDPETKRITISLPVQILRNNKIEDSTLTYTFEPDEKGAWKIALID